jgi:hypothetical protein
MLAFGALVTGLADAFKIVTGRAAKVTWREIEGRYGGRFIELVEAVLPVAEDVTVHLGTPLRHPKTANLRGKFILEHTRAGKNTNKKSAGCNTSQCSEPGALVRGLRGLACLTARCDHWRSPGASPVHTGD